MLFCYFVISILLWGPDVPEINLSFKHEKFMGLFVYSFIRNVMGI